MSEERANHFLNMIRRSAAGRLKIYLGYCAGVGKTYRMLQEGQVLKSEGIDAVAGFVETHGRIDIQQLLAGLEIIPRVIREYKGIKVEEMDVDAIVARKPAVALIDELAHNNIPGSRNKKRFQDIQEILAAGIHVITTLNVQHLESLYNTVEKNIGVKVRERIPDTVISQADQIVNVDLTTEDLIKRLKEGKIYLKDRIEMALVNFFTPANLETLRELTLRELAAQIDIRSRKEPIFEENAAIPDQVMVSLSSRGPNSELLLRYASRFAGKLNKNWYALYVQQDAENPMHIDLQTQISLSNTLTLAKQLGAIVFTYKGDDLASTILRFAHEYRIGHIIIGTPTPPSLLGRLMFKKSLSEKLIEKAEGINVMVVDTKYRHPIEIDSDSMDLEKILKKQIYLSEFLQESNILIWDDMPLKEEVLRDLSRAAWRDAESYSNVYNALLEREQQSSTFFNEGVAFPHIRWEGDFSPMISLGVIRQGIANTSTIKPIRLVFLLICSLSQNELQAKLLAAASKIASNPRLVEIIFSRMNPKEVLAEISNWEKSRVGFLV